MYIEVTPAYGRDYKNQAAVKADWAADKDFRETFSGSYINRTGALNQGLQVIVRYAKNTKTVEVK